MAARSIIARHPRRADIEKAIRAGVSVRAVAGQFDIQHFSAVARYRRGLLAGDEERRREAEGLSDEVKAALFRGRSPSGGARDVLWQVSTPGWVSPNASREEEP